MKYIILSFLLLGLASCSFSHPFSQNVQEGVTSELGTGGVRVSDSGASASSSESGDISVGADGSISVKDGSGNVSVSDTGVSVISWNDTVTTGKKGAKVISDDHAVPVWKDGTKIGTGIKVPDKKIDDMAKDPEVQGITQDIDNILNGIGTAGK